MDNPEKRTTYDTPDEEKQKENNIICISFSLDWPYLFVLSVFSNVYYSPLSTSKHK